MRLRPTIRLRLTLLYAGLFLVCGALLLGIGYAVVRNAFEPQVKRLEAPLDAAPGTLGPQAADEIAVAPRPAELEKRFRDALRRRDEAALRSVLGWFAVALAALTVLAVGIGWLAAGRALAPVSRITETARRISGRRLHERIALDGPRDELRELADTFDEMLARLDATFVGHRRFVANASHELRTPLTIVRAELEELADTALLAGEQEAMLANARRAVGRSEALIASLLILARSDGRLERRQGLDLATLVRRGLQTPRARPVDGIRPHLDLRPAVVEGDPVLLESLVVNLLENALRYNRPGGDVWISTSRDDAEAVLEVANTGPHVGRDEIEPLFAPFARPDRGRASTNGGTGLGLSIVRAVAVAHGGGAAARPRDGGGLAMTVRLPAPSRAARVGDARQA